MAVSVDGASVIDCVTEGGGVLGAFADGCYDVLLPHIEIATLSGTSAGMGTSARILWAQGRAADNTGTTTGKAYRASTARHFTKVTTDMWNNACNLASASRSAEMLWNNACQMVDPSRTAGATPWHTNPLALRHWEVNSKAAARYGNNANPFLNLLRMTLPCIERDLENPRLARLVTNCVDMNTGEELLTESRTLDGQVIPADLEMHAASGIVPPFFAAINGAFIDGAFCRNGPVRGAIAERSDTPLLRIALGKPDFKAYEALYETHDKLRQRAAEAFASVSEPLPTDRRTAEICYPHGIAARGMIQLPTRDEVSRLRMLGRETMQAEIDRGLLDRLQARRKPQLRLAA